MSAPSQIARVFAREVFDSRGRPTVEAEVACAGGATGRAIAPSGASKGQFEARELRDGDESRLSGSGARRAVENVKSLISPALHGLDAADQPAVDRRLLELDGTANCSRLGANAMVAVSLAVSHAAAAARNVRLVEHLHDLWLSATSGAKFTGTAGAAFARLGRELILPLPMVNMISGGLHAGKNLDFQDFLILPVGANCFRQALDWVVTVYHELGRRLRAGHLEGTLVGDEGGFGPRFESNVDAVRTLVQVIGQCGFEPGRDVAIGLDVAATHLVHEPGYRLVQERPPEMSSRQMVDLFVQWCADFPIVSIEDPLAEHDVDGWLDATRRLKDRVQLIGDDLFVTNPERFRQLTGQGLANSVLIKVNQIGTLSQTLTTMRLALEAGYWPVVSARSGETEDATIADLAVATGAGQIKIGSVARSERLAKYNQLLRLEEQLGSRAAWLGGGIFSRLRSESATRAR